MYLCMYICVCLCMYASARIVTSPHAIGTLPILPALVQLISSRFVPFITAHKLTTHLPTDLHMYLRVHGSPPFLFPFPFPFRRGTLGSCMQEYLH
ncbi:hypothetical protein F4779DRAFT_590129, partial [Xylariaceae sp. FL0662B]